MRRSDSDRRVGGQAIVSAVKNQDSGVDGGRAGVRLGRGKHQQPETDFGKSHIAADCAPVDGAARRIGNVEAEAAAVVEDRFGSQRVNIGEGPCSGAAEADGERSVVVHHDFSGRIIARQRRRIGGKQYAGVDNRVARVGVRTLRESNPAPFSAGCPTRRYFRRRLPCRQPGYMGWCNTCPQCRRRPSRGTDADLTIRVEVKRHSPLQGATAAESDVCLGGARHGAEVRVCNDIERAGLNDRSSGVGTVCRRMTRRGRAVEEERAGAGFREAPLPLIA